MTTSPLMTPEEVAALLQVETNTLAKWRGSGRGPAFSRLGHNRVRYRREDVDAWIAQRTEGATHGEATPAP